MTALRDLLLPFTILTSARLHPQQFCSLLKFLNVQVWKGNYEYIYMTRCRHPLDWHVYCNILVSGHGDHCCWLGNGFGKHLLIRHKSVSYRYLHQKFYFIVTCRNTSSTVVEKTYGILHCATERDLQFWVNSNVTALTTVNSTDIKSCHHCWSLHPKLSIVLCWCRDAVFSPSDTQLKGWTLKGTKLHASFGAHSGTVHRVNEINNWMNGHRK